MNKHLSINTPDYDKQGEGGEFNMIACINEGGNA